jgi:hypothetical protein
MAIMQIKIPCCDSIRTCKLTAVYIHDIVKDEIVDTIKAIRCYKLGYTPEITIEYETDRHLIYYLYVSNRGNPHISIYHIPPTITKQQAHEIILKTHSLTH